MAIDQQLIHKAIGRLRKFAKNVPKQPSPEDVHKVRTSARRLEAIFGALSLDSGTNEQRLIKLLRKVRRRAGKVRDLDVLTGHLNGVRSNGESECEVQLLEFLGSERDRQAGKLHSLIGKRRAELRARLRKTDAKVDRLLGDGGQESAALATARALLLSSQLDNPKRFNKGNLHPYRLKVKELRYVLQMAPSADSKFVEELGKVKDTIGEWHDWEELVAIANDVLGHRRNCKLIRQLKEISDSKYQQAVAVTEQMRREYLSPSPRKKPSGRFELKPPVVGAAAKLSQNAA